MRDFVKPKTYLSKVGSANNKYVFVSYSHRDSEIVYQVLEKLHNEGVNYWYDVEFTAGDVWNVEAEKKLRSPNCVGILFFLSENSLMSDAVYEEISIYMDLKSKNEIFAFIPVSLNGTTLNSYISKIYALKDNFPLDRLNFYDNVFKNNSVIIENYENLIDSVKTLLPSLRKIHAFSDFKVSNEDNNKIGKLKDSYLQGGEWFLECGEYNQEIKILREVNKIIAKIPKTINWKFICSEKGFYYFLSEYCLDFAISNGAKKVLTNLAEQISPKIGSMEKIVFMDSNFVINHKNRIGDNITTEYADLQRTKPLRLFWLSDGLEKRFLNSENEILELPEYIMGNEIEAGIRPLLVINVNKI